MFDPAVRDTSCRDFDWLEKIWRRNLISENQERIVAKIIFTGNTHPAVSEKISGC